MLSERKQKVIYSNPRGLLWANDKTKYGQRLMESMGWTEGKGLGKCESGVTENVKANFKFDNKGLGYKIKATDWIEDNNVYEQILSDLSKYHDIDIGKTTNKSKKIAENNEKIFDLEQKSQVNGRLQSYRRFIKAKNLASKSETDLYCIFPTMKKQNCQNKIVNDLNSKSEKIENVQIEQTITTIEQKVSVNDYFKMKMQNIKMKSNRTNHTDIEDKNTSKKSKRKQIDCSLVGNKSNFKKIKSKTK